MKFLFGLIALAGVFAAHYENPKPNGCASDEIPIQVTGLPGDFCSPECTKSACPTDVPTGVTANPTCALQTPRPVKKYCALICKPGTTPDQCGTATCKPIQGTGVCTYDD